VNIRAVYTQNEAVNLTIAGNNLYNSVNLTADSTGIVDYANWTVPLNASIGTYNVGITSTSGPTTKSPPDSQNFTIPGFPANVTALNLAGDTVQSVRIEVLENDISLDNQTTGSGGLATFLLETGAYTCRAYYKDEKVGERPLEITGSLTTNISCNLTNLGIRVITISDGVEIGLPEAAIFVTPINQTYATGITGAVTVHSLLPDVAYTLNVSRYGRSFNFTSIPPLLVDGSVVAWSNVTFVTPTLTMQINVVRGDGQPIGGALVKIQESLGGLYHEGNTSAEGVIGFTSAFGRYNVKVYDSNGIELNRTTVDLFEDANVTVQCNLYDLSFSVKVVDYFGQPIQNANMVLRREGLAPITKTTGADGMVTFANLVAGDFEVTVYLPGQSEPAAIQYFVAENMTILRINIVDYVVLAGFLVQTAHIAIAVIVLLTVILVLSLEIYRRKRSKAQKTSAE
jgi:hypothetical protein